MQALSSSTGPHWIQIRGIGMQRRTSDATREVSPVEVRLQLGSREGQARPVEMAERLVVVLKPGNSGGAKGPQFRDNAGSSKGPGYWREPNTPKRSGAVGSVARDREESLGHERPVCLSVTPCPRAGCGKSACPVRRAGSGNGAWWRYCGTQRG